MSAVIATYAAEPWLEFDDEGEKHHANLEAQGIARKFATAYHDELLFSPAPARWFRVDRDDELEPISIDETRWITARFIESFAEGKSAKRREIMASDWFAMRVEKYSRDRLRARYGRKIGAGR
jgi:hypothetical protein